jgi:hypothetical protein
VSTLCAPDFTLACALLPSLLSGVAYNQDLIPKARAKAREPAPHFNATTTDGEKFSNVSIKGKVVLLEFSERCPVSRASLTDRCYTSERFSKSLFGKSIPEYNQKQRAGLSSVAELMLPEYMMYVRKGNFAKNCGCLNFSFFPKNSAAATSVAKGVGLVNTSKSLPRQKDRKNYCPNLSI